MTRACNCVESPDCPHESVPEQRLAEAIFGSRAPAPAAPPELTDPDVELMTALARRDETGDGLTAPAIMWARVNMGHPNDLPPQQVYERLVRLRSFGLVRRFRAGRGETRVFGLTPAGVDELTRRLA